MPPLERLFRTASLRLAALQTILLLVTFAAVGACAFGLVRQAEYRAAHAEIEEFEDDVTDALDQGGVTAVAEKLAAHHHDVGRDIRLADASGHVLAGHLAEPPALAAGGPKYWSTYTAIGPPGGRILAYTRPEPGGLRLSVGEYLSVRARKDDGLLFAIIGLAGLAAALGLWGGVVVGRRVVRRLDEMSKAVDAYAAGERSTRIAIGRRADAEHDHLARAINSMMDRENRLVESLRQSTSAIAHDLRKPLSHHNQEIAQALEASTTAPQFRQALIAASKRVDEVLQTFQALLHIAELEAGAPGLALEPVCVKTVAARVVDAYAPIAEAGGRKLSFAAIDPPLVINAEPRVLGRLIANLVDNALTYTRPGATVQVIVDGRQRKIVVQDDGPGVPAAFRTRIFERFARMDVSRSTPGNGLGLALAAAATRAFGGSMWAEDAKPGLCVIASFEALPASESPIEDSTLLHGP